MINSQIFETVRRDEWGNPFVLCPVCECEFKGDGVLKHIIRTKQTGEPTHTEWVKNNTQDDSTKPLK